MMSKKILAVLLSLAMLGSVANLPVFAENEEVETAEVMEKVEAEETEDVLIPYVEDEFVSEQTEEIVSEDIKLSSVSDVSLMAATHNIYTVADLSAVRDDLSGTYYLMNDIDLSSSGDWIPIGYGTGNGESFSGIFNGQGHKITGLTINNDEYDYYGLFGVVTGTVNNVSVDVSITTTKDNVGGLVGNVYNGIVYNCSSTGSVEGNENVGGLIGIAQTYNEGWNISPTVYTTVENCYSTTSVTGVKTGTSNNLGGLIGKVYNYYKETRNYGNTDLTTVIKRSYATGYVKPKNDDANYGGLIGVTTKNEYSNKYPTILFCYYDKNTTKASDTDRSFSATTAQMKTQSIFTGWDFDNVWGINSNINNGYPYLKIGSTTYNVEGIGTIDSPYLIDDTFDLVAITEGRLGDNNSYYRLTKDIVLDAVFWTPIGGNLSGRNFEGVFDGAGHTISNVNITQDNFANSGLFGVVTGTVKNLGVTANISVSNNNVGALIGNLWNGSCENCYSTGSVTGNENVGGLIGIAQTYNEGWNISPTVYATVENCYSTTSVTGVKIGTSNNLGGLIGKVYNYYKETRNYGNTDLTTVIKRSYATGYVKPKNDGASYGGLIGVTTKNEYSNKYPTILFCYYDKNTTKASDTDRSFSATTAQMKTQSIFTGWDFDNVWGISESINNGYPYLKFGVYEYENEGSGSKYDPYMIYSVEDLIAIIEGRIGKEGSCYELANDITLDAVFWTPIGGNLSGRNFEGVFDGAGHTISNVNITQDNFANSGLFGVVTGTVKNLGVTANISVSNNNVGALIGNLWNGSCENCYSLGSATGNENVGGLIGIAQTYNEGWNISPTVYTTVENCYSKSYVNGLETGTSNNLGGLIGKVYNYYKETRNYGNTDLTTVIKRSYATGYVKPKNDDANYGGLIGVTTKNEYSNKYPTILFCYYDKDTTRVSDTNKGFSATTAQMKTQSIFTGWDFDNVWGINANQNNGYPYLKFGEYEYDNEGSGSKYDPYMIYSIEDLIAIIEGRIGKEGSCYELANDIVLDAVFWTPIGGNLSGRNFEGVFDGAGHTISNVNITQDNFANSGLFGVVTGTVKNLGVTANISVSNNNVGALIGNLWNGSCENCYSTGSVTGNENVGGLIGIAQTYNEGWNINPTVYTSVENCYSKTYVNGLETGISNNLGGLIGKVYNYYKETRNYGNTDLSTTIKNCYSTGEIKALNNNAKYGGTIGGTEKNQYSNNMPEITACYYDQSTTGMSDTGKGIPLTASQAKTKFSYSAWDFDSVWAISSLNEGYPYLQEVTPMANTAVTEIAFSKTSTTIQLGLTETLVPTIVPSNATNKHITWTSSKEDVATVNNGVVTANSIGTAIITAKTSDGGYTATCTITVVEKTDEPTEPDNPNPPVTDGAVVKVSSVTASAGNTVSVTVDLSGNKGFANLGIQVGYDANNLTLTSVTNNASVGATYTGAQSITTNPYNMGWDSTNNVTYNGNLATLTFKVKENAAEGKYPITVSYYTGVGGNYTDGEDVNYDADFNSLGLNYVNGAITVSSHIAGDINGDGKVNNQDGTFLLRHLAGWNVNVDESALDVNGDGRVNNQDGTVLLRYLAGWSVTIH